jgi:hypothetical protein
LYNFEGTLFEDGLVKWYFIRTTLEEGTNEVRRNSVFMAVGNAIKFQFDILQFHLN